MTSISSTVSETNDPLVSEQQLWDRLKQGNLVEGERPEQLTNFTPWYIRAAQGIAGWVSGLFLLGFVVALLATVFDFESTFAVIFFGVAGNGLAYLMVIGHKKSEFVQQQSLAFNLCGQSLFAWGLFTLFDSWSVGFFLSLLLYQFLIIYYIQDYSSRVITTWFAMFALYATLTRLGLPDLNMAFAASLFAYVWFKDSEWGEQKTLWEPIGFGVAFSFYQIKSNALFSEVFDELLQSSSSQWLELTSFWLGELILSGILVYLVFTVVRRFEVILSSSTGVLLVAGCLLMLLVRHYIPGTDAAMLLLLVGFVKQRRILFVLGLLAFITFLSWYYYQLDLTLLAKSISLIIAGGGFIMAYLLLSLKIKTSTTSNELSHDNSINLTTETPRVSQRQKGVVVATSFLILVLINLNVYQKEDILEHGQLVLLKLAPVDPRSLMQGDYMRLRFDIERALLDGAAKKRGTVLADVEPPEARKNSDTFVVAIDENRVGSYLKTGEYESLESNQLKMQFRIRDGRIQLATHAFFFQEGTAKEYENAAYGEFRVATNGELLLNNLRDDKFEILGYNRPSN